MDTAFTGCESRQAAKKMDKAATGRARYRYVSSSDKSWLTHHLGRDLERQIVSSFVGLKPTLAATIADGKSLQAAIRTKLLALDAVVCGVTEVDQVSALRPEVEFVTPVTPGRSVKFLTVV